MKIPEFFSRLPKDVQIVLSLIFLSFQAGLGQSVTIGHESAPVEYYRLPDEPLPASYTTYTAEMDVRFRELANSGFTATGLMDQYLKLEGYRKVVTRGDVEIIAGIGDFTNWGEYRKTSRHKSKDKDGQQREITKYYIELRYSMPISVSVLDKEGRRLIDEYVFSGTDTRTWISPSYSSSSELESYWRIQRQQRLNTLQKERIQESMKKISDMINYRFGFMHIRDNVKFETIGKKKHEDYEKYQANVEIMKAGFKLMDADKGLEEVKAKIKPSLAFYSTATTGLKSGKDAERLKHICHYNQALAYLWTEDFEQATTHAEALKKLNAKDKDAKRLLEEIEYVQSSLARNNRTSRHKVKVGTKT